MIFDDGEPQLDVHDVWHVLEPHLFLTFYDGSYLGLSMLFPNGESVEFHGPLTPGQHKLALECGFG